MKLKDRIKELCTEKGISMNALESDCGFGQGYVSKLEKSTPNAKKLQKIADYFNVSLDYLMDREIDQAVDKTNSLKSSIENDAELYKAMERFMTLPDEKKKYIVELIIFLSDSHKGE